MEQKKVRYKTVNRRITIKTTEGSTLTGKVNIGVQERVSDLFTKRESPFIVLFDAEHRGSSGKVYIINKNHSLP